MLLLLLMKQWQKHPIRSCMKNLGLILQGLEIYSSCLPLFLKLKQVVNENITSTWFKFSYNIQKFIRILPPSHLPTPPPPPASNLTKKRTKRLIGSKLMQKFKWPNLIQYSGMASTHIGWPNQFSVHRIHMELRFVTKLRVCLSPFNEYRFNHNFQCCINPSCSCSLKTETISYLLLPCHHF